MVKNQRNYLFYILFIISFIISLRFTFNCWSLTLRRKIGPIVLIFKVFSNILCADLMWLLNLVISNAKEENWPYCIEI